MAPGDPDSTTRDASADPPEPLRSRAASVVYGAGMGLSAVMALDENFGWFFWMGIALLVIGLAWLLWRARGHWGRP